MSQTQTCEGELRPEKSETVTMDTIPQAAQSRYHYMDNLRALAMLVGIFFHASLAYSPMMSQLWMAADPENSAVIDMVAFFSHLFRMPLFFVVAGFFTLMMFEKRGTGGTIKNRAKRIFVPFLIFLPVVLVLVVGGIGWAMQAVENPSPMLKMIVAMSDDPNAEQPPFSTMHLWFLFNLSWFYLVAAAIYHFKLHQSTLLAKLMTPTGALLVLPLLIVPAMLTQPVPHPAAERIYPELWSLGSNGVYFLFGMLLFNHQRLLDKLMRFTPVLLIASIVGYGYLYSTFPAVWTIEAAMTQMASGVPMTQAHVIQVLLQCFIGVFMTLVCLICGKQWLNGQSKPFRYIADSSYWVYILHLPVVFIIQYILLDMHMNLWVEFLISSFGTLAICMLTYVLFVRWTPLGTLLNGQRKPAFKVT